MVQAHVSIHALSRLQLAGVNSVSLLLHIDRLPLESVHITVLPVT